MSKQIIQTNDLEYKEAQLQYDRRIVLEDEILTEVKRLLPSVEIEEETLFKNVLETFYSLVESEYKKVNLMKLKGSKLVDLLDVDISNLQDLIEAYTQFSRFEKPDLKDYQIFADNAAEKDRLKLSSKVADLCNIVTKEHTLYSRNIILGFHGLVTFNPEIQEYKPNQHFIKQTRY